MLVKETKALNSHLVSYISSLEKMKKTLVKGFDWKFQNHRWKLRSPPVPPRAGLDVGSSRSAPEPPPRKQQSTSCAAEAAGALSPWEGCCSLRVIPARGLLSGVAQIRKSSVNPERSPRGRAAWGEGRLWLQIKPLCFLVSSAPKVRVRLGCIAQRLLFTCVGCSGVDIGPLCTFSTYAVLKALPKCSQSQSK